ncbi:MAG: cofactor-independent phosphoglycerate mutase [Dehalococcoidia bacterium]|nr:cofactor-independent phosphoglycerate mutase [Dehalococcoidia bacterium]
MKFCVIIIDGASGWPLRERRGKTSLELAETPNLDRLAAEGMLGLARTVPHGMEPSSACACMSIMGYDPAIYYRGRSAIEAAAMGVPIDKDEVVFRCNLVTVKDGMMFDYSAGHVLDSEAHELVRALQSELGSDTVRFYPGVSYRHLCKVKGRPGLLAADCTPPHDIPGKPVADFLPRGPGSDFLLDLMERSKDVLRSHPVNRSRISSGKAPATMIWLFWGSGTVPQLPRFNEAYGISAAMTSGVDLLRGLAKMTGIEVLDIQGVTGGSDNDYARQAGGALDALGRLELVLVHVEAPDEAGHGGCIEEKIRAIEQVDSDIVGRFLDAGLSLRMLVMPDHATPIDARTHVEDPVPFVLWGPGFAGEKEGKFSESDAGRTGVYIDRGYELMRMLVQK